MLRFRSHHVQFERIYPFYSNTFYSFLPFQTIQVRPFTSWSPIRTRTRTRTQWLISKQNAWNVRRTIHNSETEAEEDNNNNNNNNNNNKNNINLVENELEKTSGTKPPITQTDRIAELKKEYRDMFGGTQRIKSSITLDEEEIEKAVHADLEQMQINRETRARRKQLDAYKIKIIYDVIDEMTKDIFDELDESKGLPLPNSERDYLIDAARRFQMAIPEGVLDAVDPGSEFLDFGDILPHQSGTDAEKLPQAQNLNKIRAGQVRFLKSRLQQLNDRFKKAIASRKFLRDIDIRRTRSGSIIAREADVNPIEFGEADHLQYAKAPGDVFTEPLPFDTYEDTNHVDLSMLPFDKTTGIARFLDDEDTMSDIPPEHAGDVGVPMDFTLPSSFDLDDIEADEYKIYNNYAIEQYAAQDSEDFTFLSVPSYGVNPRIDPWAHNWVLSPEYWQWRTHENLQQALTLLPPKVEVDKSTLSPDVNFEDGEIPNEADVSYTSDLVDAVRSDFEREIAETLYEDDHLGLGNPDIWEDFEDLRYLENATISHDVLNNEIAEEFPDIPLPQEILRKLPRYQAQIEVIKDFSSPDLNLMEGPVEQAIISRYRASAQNHTEYTINRLIYKQQVKVLRKRYLAEVQAAKQAHLEQVKAEYLSLQDIRSQREARHERKRLAKAARHSARVRMIEQKAAARRAIAADRQREHERELLFKQQIGFDILLDEQRKSWIMSPEQITEDIFAQEYTLEGFVDLGLNEAEENVLATENAFAGLEMLELDEDQSFEDDIDDNAATESNA